MIVRRALILACAALAILPFSQAHAISPRGGGSGAVVLRYRFTPGQQLAYRFTEALQLGIGRTPLAGLPGNQSTGAPPLISRAVLSGLFHERVLQVDAQGGATVEERLSAVAITSTINGRTSSPTLPAIPVQTLHIAADGSQQGSVHSGSSLFGLQTMGMLPAGPVMPGARWATREHESLPAAGTMAAQSLDVTVQNTLLEFGQVNGEPVAVISSTAPLRLDLALTAAGRPIHLHMTGQLANETDFGLSSGQIVTSQSREEIAADTQTTLAGGKALTLHEHIALQLSLQRLGM